MTLWAMHHEGLVRKAFPRGTTILECIAARWVGLEVCGVSLVTNAGAGYSEAPLTHAEVLESGLVAGPRLAKVIRRFVADLGEG